MGSIVPAVEAEDDRAATSRLGRERLDERGLADAADAVDEDDERAFRTEDAGSRKARSDSTSDEARALVLDPLADREGHVITCGVCAGCQCPRMNDRKGRGLSPAPDDRDAAGQSAAVDRSRGSPGQQSVGPPLRLHVIWSYAPVTSLPLPQPSVIDADEHGVEARLLDVHPAVNSWREPPKW